MRCRPFGGFPSLLGSKNSPYVVSGGIEVELFQPKSRHPTTHFPPREIFPGILFVIHLPRLPNTHLSPLPDICGVAERDMIPISANRYGECRTGAGLGGVGEG